MNSSEARQLMDMLVDGDIRPEDVERLADYLAEHSDLVPELRADLRLSERLSQALCGTRTAEAFAAMTETRISAEESADKFTSGVMGRIAVHGEQVIRPSVWHRWLIPLAAAASLALIAGVYWLKPAESLGLRIAEVKGEVTVTRDGKSVPVVQGMEIRQRERVVVGKGGKAGVKYDGEETTIELHGATARFASEKGAKRVTLAAGNLVCTAAPQKMPFRIETPHAIAEVVGTHFWLGVTEVETTLTVLAGKVALRQKENRLQVSAGETAVADAAGLRRLSPGDAWIRDLLVRAETGPWDVVNLGTGLYSNGVWRMDARGGSAERRIWNMLSGGNDLHQMVIFRDGKRWARGVVVGRMMILPESQAALEVAGAAPATNMAWRTYNYRVTGAPAAYHKLQRASVSLTYGPPGEEKSLPCGILIKDECAVGVWYRFAVYFDTETPDGLRSVNAAWPDETMATPQAAAWLYSGDKRLSNKQFEIGLEAKSVRMVTQGLKFVPLGPDMPLPPKELLGRK